MAARRSAISLIEVLVVVAILGILAGLILPAIQSARESSRRAECMSNQRQLAVALMQFDEVRGHLPGYNNLQAVDSTGTQQPASWVFMVLPFLESQEVYDFHSQTGPESTRGATPNTLIGGLRCPSDAWAFVKGEGSNQTSTSYVVNCGQVDVIVNPQLPPDWRANGAFMHLFPNDNRGNMVRGEKTSIDYISRGDGSAKTLMLSENIDAGFWTDADERNLGFVWEATLVDGKPAPAAVARINERAGERWETALASRLNPSHSGTGANLACVFCGPYVPLFPPTPPLSPWEFPEPEPDDVPAPPDPTPFIDDAHRLLELARPSSYHPNGVVATFADGHVEFLAEDIDHRAYCQLMTSNHEKATLAGTIDPLPNAYLSQ